MDWDVGSAMPRIRKGLVKQSRRASFSKSTVGQNCRHVARFVIVAANDQETAVLFTCGLNHLVQEHDSAKEHELMALRRLHRSDSHRLKMLQSAGGYICDVLNQDER